MQTSSQHGGVFNCQTSALAQVWCGRMDRIAQPGRTVRIVQTALGDAVGVVGAAAVAYERLAPVAAG